VVPLEDSVKGNPVFKEWACSWARRAIIQTPFESSTRDRVLPSLILLTPGRNCRAKSRIACERSLGRQKSMIA